MSWLFSQALVEEYSEGTSLGGEPCAQLNVMPTQQQFWRNDKTMDVLKRSPFGLTWKPLTASRGEELLMLFRAAFPARTSPAPEKEQESKGSDQVCGSTWRELCLKCSHVLSMPKIVRSLLWDEDLEPSSVTLPKWGRMSANGELWERTMPEHLTSGTASGLWRTPASRDYKGASDPEKRMAAGKQVGLNDQVKFPTPAARDYKGANSRQHCAVNGTGRKHMDQLANAVAYPDLYLGTEQQEQIGGQLNPPWVEWLMGWPIGWTDLKPLEMDKFHQWQNSHSKF